MKKPKFNPNDGIVFGPQGADFASEIERAEKTPLTPEQQKISDIASAAIKEVEDVFEGGTFTRDGKTFTHSKISDEDVGYILALVRETGLSREEIRDRFMSLKAGEYFIAAKRVFFRTGDGKVQEAAAYVNRLEKVTANAMKMLTEWQNKWADEHLARMQLKEQVTELQAKLDSRQPKSWWLRLKELLFG